MKVAHVCGKLQSVCKSFPIFYAHPFAKWLYFSSYQQERSTFLECRFIALANEKYNASRGLKSTCSSRLVLSCCSLELWDHHEEIRVSLFGDIWPSYPITLANSRHLLTAWILKQGRPSSINQQSDPPAGWGCISKPRQDQHNRPAEPRPTWWPNEL